MYRTPTEYERMVDLAISIIEDYNLTIDDYPLDMDKLYKRMKIQLVPYSAYDCNNRAIELLLKRSKDGFYVPQSESSNLTVFYNDIYGEHLTKQRISQTKGHELKHIFENDKDDSEDDLCDYFSKYLRCPTPLFMYLNICSTTDLISKFDLSFEQAGYVINNKRFKESNRKFYPKEVELLKQLIGPSFNKDDIKIM